MIFSMFVATIQLLNYIGRQSKKQNLQFMLLTPAFFKRGHGHQTWYESVDQEQSCDHVKFERPHLNSVQEKANFTILVKSENVNYLPSICVKGKIDSMPQKLFFLKTITVKECSLTHFIVSHV